jgi:DNA mismatch endonuclease, patch repair protein
MADIWNKRKRSAVMSLVRSQGNKATELRLVTIFRQFKITGWRRGQKLIGKPDFVFRRERVAVFVDGCFWHGCLSCYRRPNSNQKYWDAKVIRNRERDREINKALRKRRWRVIRIWEHQLRSLNRLAHRFRGLSQSQGTPDTLRSDGRESSQKRPAIKSTGSKKHQYVRLHA